MSDEIRITLRLPRNVHTAVKKAADHRSRSMNEEIVTVLSEYYQVVGEMSARIDELEGVVRILVDTIVKNTPAIPWEEAKRQLLALPGVRHYRIPD